MQNFIFAIIIDFITTVDGEDHISGAAVLLFGKNPQKYFPRARIRFVRYEGTKAEVGDRMNVIKDVKFTGKILDQINDAIAYVKTQIREYTKLGAGAVFKTIPEYPEFCWTELIVNAGAHRDYSIKGTDIQIKMFDDHLVVESPGILPGPVRVNNIRDFRFSRNPKIVELLNEYDLVKEFGEGVDRVYLDMEEAGVPDPVYQQKGFMLFAELRNKNYGVDGASWYSNSESDDTLSHSKIKTDISIKLLADILEFCKEPRSRAEIQEYCGYKFTYHFRENVLKPLLEGGQLVPTMPDKPKSPKQKYVSATKA